MHIIICKCCGILNDFDNFMNQDFKSFSRWLDSLNSYEFALYGVIAAFLIAPALDANSQNSLGNWLEEVGQILLTISAQTFNINNSNNFNNDLERMKRDIYNIKNKVNKKD